MGVNKVIAIGNLGADPELRQTGSGTPVCNFRIAASESFKDRDGNKQERTEWMRIVTFGKLAEICGQYLRKGRQVYVEGRIQTREWQDQEDKKRFTTEIVANQMQMLGGRDDASHNSRDNSTADSGTVVDKLKDRLDAEEVDDDDDLPF